jgi:dienelactone hydrolase
MQRRQQQLDKLAPHGKASLAEYKKVLRPAWKRTMQLEMPERGVIAEFDEASRVSDDANKCSSSRLAIGRNGKGDRISAVMIYPQKANGAATALLVNPKGMSAFVDAHGAPIGLARELVQAGVAVIAFDAFTSKTNRGEVDLFFATYNKTTMQERVQDIATVCAFARGSGKASRKLVLIGEGEMGLAAMLAAPLVDAVVADCTMIDNSDLLRVKPEIFVPGLRSVGDFCGVAALAAPNPILVCAGKKFSVEPLKDVYKAVHASNQMRVEYALPKDGEIVKWIVAQK